MKKLCLDIIQHSSTYLLHHHKPSTAEESMAPFAPRRVISFKLVEGTETWSPEMDAKQTSMPN